MLSDWGNARISFYGFITFLEDYAASDFSAEEAFMLHHACPEYQQHKQHARYLSILSGLKQGLAELGPFYVLSVRISQIAINRIFSHILNTDKKLRTNPYSSCPAKGTRRQTLWNHVCTRRFYATISISYARELQHRTHAQQTMTVYGHRT